MSFSIPLYLPLSAFPPQPPLPLLKLQPLLTSFSFAFSGSYLVGSKVGRASPCGGEVAASFLAEGGVFGVPIVALIMPVSSVAWLAS